MIFWGYARKASISYLLVTAYLAPRVPLAGFAVAAEGLIAPKAGPQDRPGQAAGIGRMMQCPCGRTPQASASGARSVHSRRKWLRSRWAGQKRFAILGHAPGQWLVGLAPILSDAGKLHP